jgi:hypothetical protein
MRYELSDFCRDARAGLADKEAHARLRDTVLRATQELSHALIAGERPPALALLVARGLHEVLLDNEKGGVFRAKIDRLGVSLDLFSGPSLTPISLVEGAILSGPSELVAWLLHKGCAPSARNKVGDTPLHLAVRCDSLASAMELLRHHADINARGQHGQTPALLAARGKHLILLNALASAGADLSLADEFGHSAMSLALSHFAYGRGRFCLRAKKLVSGRKPRMVLPL